MFTVALIGPDGAGKTTVGRQMECLLPVPVKYLYMGVNHDASDQLLPTTRAVQSLRRMLGKTKDAGGPLDHREATRRPRGPVRRVFRSLKAGLSLTNRFAEEWYRQAIASYYQRRGHIVLFDRHFFTDYFAYDIVKTDAYRPLSRRIHGFVLNHLYPKPDLVILLDAAAEVLMERKGEGTIELLERRRNDYLQMRDHVKHFEVVDASVPVDEVAFEVSQRICRFLKTHARPETAGDLSQDMMDAPHPTAAPTTRTVTND